MLAPNLNDNYRVSYLQNILSEEKGELINSIAALSRTTSQVILSGGGIYENPIKEYGGGGILTEEPVRYPTTCKVEPIGIADFIKIEQTLICYQPGEIAHIENILKTEKKTRDTRELHQTETTVFTSNERDEENLKDTQTTDRFELQKETQKVIQENMSLSAGLNFSGTYGITNINGSTNFAVNTSSSTSEQSASDFAHSVTEQALNRVVTKSRTDMTVRQLYEFEEKNEHGFDNTAGNGHVVGIYRWVDKEYKCQLVNYGKRLLFNFMVPEPAAFHMYAMGKKPLEGQTILKPIDPITDGIPDPQNANVKIRLSSAANLSDVNYRQWAAAYGAEVEAYPAATIMVSKGYSITAPYGTIEGQVGKDDFTIPEGYAAATGYVRVALGHGTNQYSNLTVLIGNKLAYGASANASTLIFNNEEKPLGVSWNLYQVNASAFSLDVQCTVTAKWLETWRLKAYNAIIQAYQSRLSEYNDQLARLQTEASVYASSVNPARLRDIEKTELKQGCIQLLNSETYQGQFHAMRRPADFPNDGKLDDYDYPWFQNCEAIREGYEVQFFEMAFDWDIMSYLFYPYYWARKQQWVRLYQAEDADPIFTSFLEAGSSQVIVPVRPGFEAMVLHFIETGQIWMGQSKPPLSATQYVTLLNDATSEIEPDKANIGKPWTMRVPTNLVILQQDASGVPGTGLPCDPDGI